MVAPLLPLVLVGAAAGLFLSRRRAARASPELVASSAHGEDDVLEVDYRPSVDQVSRVPPAPLDDRALAKKLGIAPMNVRQLTGIDGLALAAKWPDFGFPPPPYVDVGTKAIGGGGTLDERALEAFKRGECPLRWVPLRVTRPPEPELVVYVPDDYLCLGDDKRARLTISRLGAQAFCKAYDWVLPTPRICDAIFGAAVVQLPMRAWNRGPWTTPPPVPASTVDNPGFSRALWLNRDTWIEAQRAGRAGLVANAGKTLVVYPGITKDKLGIYGWLTTQPPPATSPPWAVSDPIAAFPARSTWQSGPTVHHPGFLDYSQVFRPVQRYALLDGVRVDLHAVYADPRLSKLVGSSVALPPY